MPKIPGSRGSRSFAERTLALYEISEMVRENCQNSQTLICFFLLENIFLMVNLRIPNNANLQRSIQKNGVSDVHVSQNQYFSKTALGALCQVCHLFHTFQHIQRAPTIGHATKYCYTYALFNYSMKNYPDLFLHYAVLTASVATVCPYIPTKYF